MHTNKLERYIEQISMRGEIVARGAHAPYSLGGIPTKGQEENGDDTTTWKIDEIGRLEVTCPGTLVPIEAFKQARMRALVREVSVEAKEIGDHVFEDFTSLQEAVIAPGTQSVGTAAFFDCWNLQSVALPKGLETIQYGAFSGCDQLAHIHFPASLKVLGAMVFSGCAGLTQVLLPPHLEEIQYIAFADCLQLQRITIPASVRFVGRGAFMNCSSLRTIIFQGHAPVFEPLVFVGVEATIYYPGGDSTWTQELMDREFGGELRWVPVP